jgi:hypothetical protein
MGMNNKEKALFDKMTAIRREVAEAPTTEYSGEGDEVGACIHCQRISYKPHADDCLVTKVKNLLKELE